MRKFIISATVAIVAAVSFAAPSQAGYYGYGHKGHYKSYSYGHKHYGHKHYGYKKHVYKPYRFVKKWKPYGGYYGGKVIIKKGYGYY